MRALFLRSCFVAQAYQDHVSCLCLHRCESLCQLRQDVDRTMTRGRPRDEGGEGTMKSVPGFCRGPRNTSSSLAKWREYTIEDIISAATRVSTRTISSRFVFLLCAGSSACSRCPWRNGAKCLHLSSAATVQGQPAATTWGLGSKPHCCSPVRRSPAPAAPSDQDLVTTENLSTRLCARRLSLTQVFLGPFLGLLEACDYCAEVAARSGSASRRKVATLAHFRATGIYTRAWKTSRRDISPSTTKRSRIFRRSAHRATCASRDTTSSESRDAP